MTMSNIEQLSQTAAARRIPGLRASYNPRSSFTTVTATAPSSQQGFYQDRVPPVAQARAPPIYQPQPTPAIYQEPAPQLRPAYQVPAPDQRSPAVYSSQAQGQTFRPVAEPQFERQYRPVPEPAFGQRPQGAFYQQPRPAAPPQAMRNDIQPEIPFTSSGIAQAVQSAPQYYDQRAQIDGDVFGDSLPIPFETDIALINGAMQRDDQQPLVDASELPIRPGGRQQDSRSASTMVSVPQPLPSPPIMELEAAPAKIEEISGTAPVEIEQIAETAGISDSGEASGMANGEDSGPGNELAN